LQYCAHDGIRLAVTGAAIPIVPLIVAVLSPESAAWIVNAKLPALVGFPETEPSVPRTRPDGSDPALTVHLYGSTPPLADIATGE